MQQAGIDLQLTIVGQSKQRSQQQSAPNGPADIHQAAIVGPVRAQHMKEPMQARDEVRPFEQLEFLEALRLFGEGLLARFALTRAELCQHVLVQGFWLTHAEALDGGAGATREDEDALADWVRDFTLLEGAVLHRGQQVLEPLVTPRVEFVPERYWRDPAEHRVTHAVEGADQILGALELREVEFEERHLGPEHAFGQRLDGERLAGTRWAEDANAERLLLDGSVFVVADQRFERPQALDLNAIGGEESPAAERGHVRERGDPVTGCHLTEPVQRSAIRESNFTLNEHGPMGIDVCVCIERDFNRCEPAGIAYDQLRHVTNRELRHS